MVGADRSHMNSRELLNLLSQHRYADHDRIALLLKILGFSQSYTLEKAGIVERSGWNSLEYGINVRIECDHHGNVVQYTVDTLGGLAWTPKNSSGTSSSP